ncbi:MAG: ParA family protein [Pseudomonadota bacterium]
MTRPDERDAQMQTVLVANRKGGVGKTMISVSLASALAATGARVAIADADAQQSALAWLALRPADAAAIRGLSWKKAADIGEHPKKLDWLVIDAPGALKGSRAEALIAEARAVVTPLQPGLFDLGATRLFLDEIEDIKRIRKGKVPVHLVANRLRPGRAAAGLEAAAADLGRPLTARIPERAGYADLAMQGLAPFDGTRVTHRRLAEPFTPLLEALDG